MLTLHGAYNMALITPNEDQTEARPPKQFRELIGRQLAIAKYLVKAQNRMASFNAENAKAGLRERGNRYTASLIESCRELRPTA